MAHKILIAAYHMLATGVDYKDLGEAYFDGLDKGRTARGLVRRLERLDDEVTIKAALGGRFHSRLVWTWRSPSAPPPAPEAQGSP